MVISWWILDSVAWVRVLAMVSLASHHNLKLVVKNKYEGIKPCKLLSIGFQMKRPRAHVSVFSLGIWSQAGPLARCTWNRGGSRIFQRGVAVYQYFCLLYCSSPSFFMGGERGFQAFRQFFESGSANYFECEAHISWSHKLYPPRGVWGHAPPSENVEKLKPLRRDFHDSEQLYTAVN